MKITEKISQMILGKHRFAVFIIFSITISFVLVVISMAIYNSSGAAQLDLSRPGYVNVRSRASSLDSSYKDYATMGNIDEKVITEFDALFKLQSSKITTATVFSGDPLSPEALGIGAVF
jgi:hypothetical protein